MILVDTLHINDGGGKVLLDYLVEKIEASDLKVLYLFDERIGAGSITIKDSNRAIFLKASLINRWSFYRSNLHDVDTVFCFGNLPPITNTGKRVYTYFQNSMYLKVPSDFSGLKKLIYKLKAFILKRSSKNTDKFIVQSEFIKNELASKYHLNKGKILVMPFYPPLPEVSPVERVKNSFLYVSNGTPNKNHERLINAFCKFYDTFKVGTLTLTISPTFAKVYDYIEEKKGLGYPIINIGFVNRNELKKQYLKSEYLIFPSLTESFGLGVVESIENGCKVIGANVNYLFEVCKPSLVFEPLSEKSITEAIEKACFTNLNDSEKLVTNHINELIRLIESGN